MSFSAKSGVWAVLVCLAFLASVPGLGAAEEVPALRVCTFDLDVTPPVGSMMAYDPVKGTWDMGRRAGVLGPPRGRLGAPQGRP